MSNPANDTLLRLTRLVLTALLGLALLVLAGLLVAAAVFAVRGDEFAARMAAQGMEPGTLWWVVALCLLAALMAVLAFLFVRHLRRIVQSVAEGDPFVPVNADRLRTMGWLTLAFQAVAIPVNSLAIWFDAAPQHPNVHHGDDGISLGLLVLALVLFILARVFRTGAAMREELEGTV